MITAAKIIQNQKNILSERAKCTFCFVLIKQNLAQNVLRKGNNLFCRLYMEEINRRRAEFYQPDNNEVIRKIEDRELRKEIHDAINELPDKCKEVFKLSYLHDMKNKEIADVLGVSLRTVEAHMYKALKFLRNRLGHLWFILLLFL